MLRKFSANDGHTIVRINDAVTKYKRIDKHQPTPSASDRNRRGLERLKLAHNAYERFYREDAELNRYREDANGAIVWVVAEFYEKPKGEILNWNWLEFVEELEHCFDVLGEKIKNLKKR